MSAPREEGEETTRLARVAAALAPWGLLVATAAPLAAYFGPRLRGAEIHWQSPAAAWLLLLVPLGAWLNFHRDATRRPTLSYTRAAELSQVRRGWISHLAHFPRVLRLVALGLVIVALGRPQRMTADASQVEGIDIVVALDVSNSMQERDLVPDRLAAAKRVIDEFIQRRRSDRIGLVIFGKEAFTQCPLTLDYRALRGLLADVGFGLVDGQGTAIGNALGTALNRLRRSEARSKVIILLTDGDNNAGNLSPLQAAAYAQSLGVRVFTILVGRNVDQVARGPFGILAGAPRYPVNPKLLEEIAGQTGGTPYLATDTEALSRRFEAILEDLDTSRLKDQSVSYLELYPSLLLAAIGLILLEVVLSMTRLRSFP